MEIPQNADMELLAMLGGISTVFDWLEETKESIRSRKKVCRNIRKNYKEEIAQMPAWAACYFSPETTDDEMIAFLFQCRRRYEQHLAAQKQEGMQLMAGWTKDEQEGMEELLERFPYLDFFVRDNALVFVLDDAVTCFRWLLQLEDVQGDISALEQELYIEDVHFSKEARGYCLTFRIEDEVEASRTVCLLFSRVTSVNEVFWTEPLWNEDSPWQQLSYIASELCQKYAHSEDLFNEKEQALFPLLSELNCLWNDSMDIHQVSPCDFKILRALIEQYGYCELLPLVDKLSALGREHLKYHWYATRLLYKLNSQKYEPLWRHVYEKIIASQAEYPNKVKALCPPDVLKDTRQKIQQMMEQQGFQGVYPDFVKEGPLKGIHVVDSFDTLYFVGMEKRGMYRIHCVENVSHNSLQIEFVCGTALLRKGETAEDIYACMFNAKGRRLVQSIDWWLEFQPDEEDPPKDLALCVQAAVKRTTLRRLNKQERAECVVSSSGLGTFMLVLIIMGGLFGVFMTAGFMLIEFLMALAVGEISTFPTLFAETPWWQILVFCWVAFGGTMGILTVIGKNR